MTQLYDLISLAKKVVIDARDEADRIASQDAAFQNERAAAFEEHMYHDHGDFEVCTDPRCRAVVVEEVRRGLLEPGDVWPPIDPDDKPWGADDPADIDDGLSAINRLIDACERVDGIDQHAALD